MTWAEWVRLVAADVGVHDLTEIQATTLLWERTAWPVSADLEHLRPQVEAALWGEPGPCPCCGRELAGEVSGVCGRCAVRMGWHPTGCPDRW